MLLVDKIGECGYLGYEYIGKEKNETLLLELYLFVKKCSINEG